jgi:hypothetical protein
MAGERQLPRRREDAKPRAMLRIVRRKREHRFRKVELARDRLHRGGVEPRGFEHDSQRIAGEALCGEHVQREEAAAHDGLTAVRRGTSGLD